MKVLFITRSYLPNIGGVERHIEGLVPILGKKHTIDLLTESHGEKIDRTPEISTIYTIPLKGVNESAKKWYIWKWVWQHRTLFSQYDIIHVHDVIFWLYPILIQLNRKKLFATLHGWEGQWPLPKKNILKKYFDSKLVSRFITVGSFINKWYHLNPSVVTYGAVAIDSSPPVKLRPRTLLFVGRLDADTGFKECIEQFNRLQSEKKWHLAVIGDGPLRELIPANAQHFGAIAHPQAYIKSAEWVCVSGYLSLLESLVWAKPTFYVATNPLKHDYFALHPASIYLSSLAKIDVTRDLKAGQTWARSQTWDNLATTYEKLWKK